jgi:hypothetical protein
VERREPVGVGITLSREDVDWRCDVTELRGALALEVECLGWVPALDSSGESSVVLLSYMMWECEAERTSVMVVDI